MRFNFGSATLAAISLLAVVTAAPAEKVERQSTVRIMALGDSITGSPVRDLDLSLLKYSTDPIEGLLACLPLAKASTSRN